MKHCRLQEPYFELRQLPHFETHGPRPHKVLGSVAIVALAASAGAAVAGDIAAGETLFKKCMPCHSIGETAKNMIGPIQNGLKGRKSGSVPGYN
jgi:cytochrome c